MILENELSYFLELFLQYWLVPSDYVVADGLEEFILETRVMDELYKPSNQKESLVRHRNHGHSRLKGLPEPSLASWKHPNKAVVQLCLSWFSDDCLVNRSQHREDGDWD